MLPQAYQLGVFSIYNKTTAMSSENQEKTAQSTSVTESVDESDGVTTPPQITDIDVAKDSRNFVCMLSLLYCVYCVL
jgi:hypothetical protein